MRTLREFRDAETDCATAIIAKVETEVIIEVIGLREFTIDDQFEVVADAATRDVDTTLVVEFCEEIGRGIDLIAIGERTGVQVTVDRGSDGVVGNDTAARKQGIISLTMGRL